MENFSLSDRDLLTRDKGEEEEEGLCSPSRRGRTAVWSLLACLVSWVNQSESFILTIDQSGLSVTGGGHHWHHIRHCLRLRWENGSTMTKLIGDKSKTFVFLLNTYLVNHKCVPLIQESSSSNLVSTLKRGPGDDGEFGVAIYFVNLILILAPCQNYTTLTESWRRINKTRGRVFPNSLHCDSSLPVRLWDHQIIISSWFYIFRFDGTGSRERPALSWQISGKFAQKKRVEKIPFICI